LTACGDAGTLRQTRNGGEDAKTKCEPDPFNAARHIQGVNMQFHTFCLFVLLFSEILNANAQPADSGDDLAFPNIPFIASNFTGPRPQYPLEARRKGICGDVLVAVKIGEDGKVIDKKFVRSEPLNIFDNVISAAIDKWHFTRVTFDGEPVVYQTKVPFIFRLEPGQNCPNPME